jgi:hypothetical protein
MAFPLDRFGASAPQSTTRMQAAENSFARVTHSNAFEATEGCHG